MFSFPFLRLSEINNKIEEEAYLTKWLLFFYVIFILILREEFPKASPPVWFRMVAFGFVCWLVREHMLNGSLFRGERSSRGERPRGDKGGAIEFYKGVFGMAFGAVWVCCFIDAFWHLFIEGFDKNASGGIIILGKWR